MPNRDPWWTVDPETGQPIRVLDADLVERAQAKAFEAEAKVDVLCEAAARLRVLHRKTRVMPDSTPEEIETARRDVRDAIDWIARGGVEGQPEVLRAR